MLVPKLRFQREDGTNYPEWNTQKLSVVSSRVTRKNKGNVTDIPLTIASLYGLVDQREYFKKTIASQNMEGYYLLHNGEFAYNKSYSKGFDFGAIKRLDKYDCGALSTLYICFAINDKVNSDFMTHYFDSQKWNKEVSIRCAEGARNHGLLNISTDDFFDIDMTLPSDLEEQQKIADFLSTVDEVIAQSEAEVQNLEQQKKAAMQKIFSREIRFKNDDGTEFPEWEEKQFGTIMDCYSGGTPSSKNKQYYNGKIPFIRSGEIHFSETELFLSEEGLNKSAAKMVKVGDLLYALYGATSGEVDISKINGAINQAILCIIPYSDNRLYLKFWLESFKTVITTKLLQGGQGNLSAELIKSLRLPIPHIEEQQKIADFLSAYDEAISYAKQELDKWKELKKGLLQQMFV